MTMLPLPNTNKTDDLIAEFLANGGKVTTCTPGERSEEVSYTGGFYGRKKKATPVTENTENTEDPT